MIYLLLGENVFQRDQEVARLTAGREVERVDNESLAPERLGEVFQGQTLFANDVVKILDQASADPAVWGALAQWIERAGDSDIIICEQKLDKRTKTYKALQSQATIITCDYWTDRQRPHAAKWLKAYAAERGVAMSREVIADMVERVIRPSEVGKDAIIDQQRLARAVEQLKHVETINQRTLDTVLAPSVHENVFRLLTLALDGDAAAVRATLPHLSRDQDGHRMMGLLSSQLGNIVALVLGGDRTVEQVASDIGAHPFALRQLARYRTRLRRQDVARLVERLADADMRLKRSQAEPWVLIEKALVEIALLQKNSRT